MEYEEVYDAVKSACDDALNKEEGEIKNPHMMPLEAFDAFDELDDPIRVVGIINSGDGLDFVVIKEAATSTGEFFPTTVDAIYKTKSS